MVFYGTALFDYSGGNDSDESDVINDQRGIEYEIPEPDSQRDTRIFYKDVGGLSGPYENNPDIHDPSTRTTEENKGYSIDWERNADILGWDVPPESADPDDEGSEEQSSDDREATGGWVFSDRDDTEFDENDVTGRLQWGWRGGTTKWKFLSELDAHPIQLSRPTLLTYSSNSCHPKKREATSYNQVHTTTERGVHENPASDRLTEGTEVRSDGLGRSLGG